MSNQITNQPIHVVKLVHLLQNNNNWDFHSMNLTLDEMIGTRSEDEEEEEDSDDDGNKM